MLAALDSATGRLLYRFRKRIDYHVAPDDRSRPARWARDTRDPQARRRCAFSAHVGLRRSVAGNPHLLW